MDTLTAVFEQDGEWWVGSVEELSGTLIQGQIIDEAWQNLREAVLLVIEVNREVARRRSAGGT